MKAHFKYTLLAGLYIRKNVFIVIFLFNLVMVSLGAFGLLPLPLLIAAIALSGIGVSVMTITNIISDVGIIRQMLATPRAYLQMLTPVPRYKTLIANLTTIAILDIVSMAVAITGVTWLSLLLAGRFFDIFSFIRNFTFLNISMVAYAIGSIISSISGYLLLIVIIIGCIVVRKSVFYQRRAGGFLTALVTIGVFYLISLSYLLLAPFGTVTRVWGNFVVSLGSTGTIAFGVLTLIQVAVLVFITGRLMERKLNI